MELKNCPFCGSDKIAVTSVFSRTHEYDLSSVECGNCLARSGSALEDNQAVILWNIRSEDK